MGSLARKPTEESYAIQGRVTDRTGSGGDPGINRDPSTPKDYIAEPSHL